MKTKIYRFDFAGDYSGEVHFGSGMLGSSGYMFHADSLFSALYLEAMKNGVSDDLLDAVSSNRIRISDAMPYRENEDRIVYYIPKPVMPVRDSGKNDVGDSRIKKLFKNLKYIPADDLYQYLEGSYKPEEQYFGHEEVKVSAALRGEPEAVPYRIGVFVFEKGCGLYVVAAYTGDEELKLMDELMMSLSYSGIGGRRSTGIGRFTLRDGNVPDIIRDSVSQSGGNRFMSLSVSLPGDAELEEALKGADYLLEKRSGFVASGSYSDTFLRKKDIYAFAAGSCFKEKYDGEIADVSSPEGGMHPVYRYLKPLWLAVSDS